jgi:hypothetical protein
MISGSADPECRQPHSAVLSEVLDALLGADATVQTPAATEAFAADAPDPDATNDVTPATIHPTVIGAATAGRQDWANAIAMH